MIEPPAVLALLLTLYFIWKMYMDDPRVCVRCGGRGKHRHDCPFKKDDE